MGVRIRDSHVKASNIPSQFSAKTEALADEDEWSKQNPSGSLSGQHNVVGTCKNKSALKRFLIIVQLKFLFMVEMLNTF